MKQVQKIQKRDNSTAAKESQMAGPLTAIGGIAGGVVGGIYGGGPAGAMAGASAGSSLGGTIGGMIDPGEAAKESSTPQAQAVDVEENAMQRRLGEAKQNRLAVLRNAESALAQLPQQLREEYAGPIIQATMAEEKRKAMGA
jgi:uncharacterized protein YcfJ